MPDVGAATKKRFESPFILRSICGTARMKLAPVPILSVLGPCNGYQWRELSSNCQFDGSSEMHEQLFR